MIICDGCGVREEYDRWDGLSRNGGWSEHPSQGANGTKHACRECDVRMRVAVDAALERADPRPAYTEWLESMLCAMAFDVARGAYVTGNGVWKYAEEMPF